MHRLTKLITRFARDERGVFAVIYGLVAIVLVAVAGAVVDYVALEQARTRAQAALDAAALALQPEVLKNTVDTAGIETKAAALLQERLGNEFGAVATLGPVTVDVPNGQLTLEADLRIPTIFVSLVGVPELRAYVQSQATRGSMDIEVAVAVDVTGSMGQTIPGQGSQTKIAALSDALNELIDIVVQDQQTPSHSKMALVPYSMAVNVGGYADTIRGAVTQPTAITAIGWSSSPARNITGITRASPAVVTANNHGFATNDYVYVNDVRGMTTINNRIYQVTVVNSNSFRLNGVNSRSYGSYSGGGTVTRCSVSTCELVVVSANHGLATNERAYIYNAGGVNSYNGSNSSSAINNSSQQSGGFLFWTIGTTTTNTFVLPGTARTNGRSYGNYTSGGEVSCLRYDCKYYAFLNRYNSWRKQPVSTCVTERNPNGFTDEPPTTTLLGRNFPSSSNTCLTNTILPLTADKTVLRNAASGLVAGGSTGGHIGVGWAWNLVSPRFNGPWPTSSQPSPANATNVVRAVVMMTDGEFNSVYCNGVIAQDSTSGSGDTNTHIGCNAPNGSSYVQAEALCQAMKDAGVRVYTVGFAVVNSPNARNLMRNCATDPSYAYEANSGQALIDVFRSIGRNLTQLRLTK